LLPAQALDAAGAFAVPAGLVARIAALGKNDGQPSLLGLGAWPPIADGV
jgi:hypothetical protein